LELPSASGTTDAEPTGVSVYIAGPVDATKAVVIIPDIYGWNGGRTRAVADYYGSQGYRVLVPRILCPPFEGGTDGDGFPGTFGEWEKFVPFMQTFNWESSFKPKFVAIKSYLQSTGVTKTSLIVFCFGGWPIFKALADSDLAGDFFVGAAVPHPSVQLDERAFGGDTVTLVASVKQPVLLLPAGNDDAKYDLGGEWCPPNGESVRFPDQTHGWVPRGDVTNDGTARDVDTALGLIDAFFSEKLFK
jgi:carboxymethylenebutenolidase